MDSATTIGLDERRDAGKTSDVSLFNTLADLGLPFVGSTDPGFRSALFNGDVTPRPLACLTCANEDDVRRAVRAAADHGVPMAVLAGGHDLSGRAFREGNLVLDLRSMSGVSVDAAAGEVTFEGGVLVDGLLAALPDELVTVTATISSVGMTGFTLGGGYGRLDSRFGLAVDGVKRARIVLADGRVVVASDQDDADLLWALRGGGSGFGVVTSMTVALHKLPKVLTAKIVIPLPHAELAMLRYQEMVDAHPVDLSVFAGFMAPPGVDHPVLFIAPLWCGAPDEGEALIDDLETLPGARVLQRGWSTYRHTFDKEFEKAGPKGRHYCLPTRNIRRIDDTSAAILVEGAKRMTSAKCAIALHDFHGAPARVAADATAFPLREDHVVVEIIGAWDPDAGDDGGSARAWAQRLSADLAAVALPGGYVNLLAPDEEERVRLFYGPSAARLLAIKRRVDPNDMFRAGTGRMAAGA